MARARVRSDYPTAVARPGARIAWVAQDYYAAVSERFAAVLFSVVVFQGYDGPRLLERGFEPGGR